MEVILLLCIFCKINDNVIVLILVFMEVILLHNVYAAFVVRLPKVLILVFMEVILLLIFDFFLPTLDLSFNPCFYGSYSFTRRNSTH